MLSQPHHRSTLLLSLAGALLYLPFLGGVHLFDWDEINFAEAAREMLATGVYGRVYIDYEAFWEKPPLFFWMQALAMHGFGVNEVAARLPNAICGIITLPILYRMGRQLYSHRLGLLWALGYMGSVLPFLYFKSGIIDPVFNLFIFLGVYFFIRFYWKKEGMASFDSLRSSYPHLVLAGLFIGLAILTKGPVAYLIAGLTGGVYWLYQRLRWYVSPGQVLVFTLVAALVPALWFGVETYRNGPWFVQTFLAYQYRLFSTPDAGHGGFPGYHFVVLLVGCFPASVFALRALVGGMPEQARAHEADFVRWMKILFWVVLILFSIVQSKIVHYSSLCYFPLTFLAALSVEHLLAERLAFARWMKALLLAVGGLFVLLTVALPVVAQRIDWLRPLIQDPFGRANLDAEVAWHGWEVLPGLWLLGVLVLFVRQSRQPLVLRHWVLLYGGTAIFVLLTLIFYIGRIEGYSQRAAIEFYKSKAEEDCYIITHGFKSYAHLYYAQKRPGAHPQSHERDWLLYGEADKPVYVVTRLPRSPELDTVQNLTKIGSKNGFVFYERR